MASLLFHKALYDRVALEQTVAAFQDYGRVGLHASSEDDYLRVDLECSDPADNEELEGAFANYALALSVERAGSAS